LWHDAGAGTGAGALAADEPTTSLDLEQVGSVTSNLQRTTKEAISGR